MSQDADPRQEAVDALEASVWIRPGPSSIAEVGLLAVRPIPVGTVVWRSAGDQPAVLVADDCVASLPDGVQEVVRDYFGHHHMGYYLPADGLTQFDLVYLANHAEDPNCERDGLELRTIRSVERGEEITIAYPAEAIRWLQATGRWGGRGAPGQRCQRLSVSGG